MEGLWPHKNQVIFMWLAPQKTGFFVIALV